MHTHERVRSEGTMIPSSCLSVHVFWFHIFMIVKLEIDFWENPSLYTENKNIIYGIVNVLRNKNGDPTVQEDMMVGYAVEM
jgi:hypothetical protein